MNPVIEWFGNEFKNLHPMLQELHRHGGNLSGIVEVDFGSGIAGVFGRRLASKLGIPTQPGKNQLDVTISHNNSALLWARKFNGKQKMTSIFIPHGRYPVGYWSESSGYICLGLGVEIIDGGWFWVQRQFKLHGIPCPQWLFPSSYAYKRIKNDMYEFSVTLTMPLLGKLVKYSGILKPVLKSHNKHIPQSPTELGG